MLLILKIRKGDINIIPTSYFKEIGDGWEFTKGKKLASSQVTGNAHHIKRGRVQLYVKDAEDIILLKVLSKTALLEHEEHESFEIPKGEYIVCIQQEADPFERIMRRVAD